MTENLRNRVYAYSGKATRFVAQAEPQLMAASVATGVPSEIMCFASANERACHSHNSVEMTPFRENVLGTVFGKGPCSGSNLLLAFARRSRGGLLFEKGDRQKARQSRHSAIARIVDVAGV